MSKELINERILADAIIHPNNIPGNAVLASDTDSKYLFADEGVGFKIIHKDQCKSVYIRTNNDEKNGPHIQYHIPVNNKAGNGRWLLVGISKIVDGTAILENLEVDKPLNIYHISDNDWYFYKMIINEVMKMLILYASITRIRYGLPVIVDNYPKMTESLYTAILPEDEPKKAENNGKSEANQLKEFAEALKKLSEEVNSLKEAQKNADSEENFKKWKEETSKWLMEVVKTREIPAENEEKTVTSREIFLRLNKAVRGFCIGAHSLISESGASDSFLETISVHNTINMNSFMKLLSEPNIKRCQTALKEGTINQYRMTCKIESFYSGSVYYTFTLRDEILYRDGVTIMFAFNEKSRLVNAIKTIEQFEQIKTNPLFSYITSVTGGDTTTLCRSIAHICGDLKKKYIKEEKK